VVGAANDVLEQRDDAELLAARGIVYVPDFVSNAGGVLQIHAERSGWEADRLDGALAALGPRTFDLLDEATATRALPLHVAEGWVSAKLGRRVTIPD
jgi:leucine dehydrogenase